MDTPAANPPPLPAHAASDPLAGATIAIHDAGAAPSALEGAAVPPTGGPGRGLVPDWQRLRIYGGGALVALCLGLVGWQAWRGRDPAPVTVQTIQPAIGAEIKVYVSGAVATPGVYRLAQGDRIEDAVRAAGGFATDADSNRLNLAQRVHDEQRLDVPARARSIVAGASGGTGSPAPAGDGAAGDGAADGETAGAAETAGTPAAGQGAAVRATRTPRPASTPRPTAARHTVTPHPTSTPRSTSTPRPSARQPTAAPEGSM